MPVLNTIKRLTMAGFFLSSWAMAPVAWAQRPPPIITQSAPAPAPTPSPSPASSTSSSVATSSALTPAQQLELAQQQAAAQNQAAQQQFAQQQAAAAQSQNMAAMMAQMQNAAAAAAAKMIGMALIASGTAMVTSCAPSGCQCCPAGMMQIAMGGMALAQSGANTGAAANHGYNGLQNQAGSGDSGVGDNGQEPAPDLGGAPGTGVASRFDINSAIKPFGGSYDPKTGKVTLPNGKSFSLSDLSSADAMAKAGVSSDEYKAAMDIAKAAEKKALEEAAKQAKARENGFESGSGSVASGAAAAAVPGVAAGAGGGLGGGSREPTSVAGMVRNFNGDLIGVSGDDIFSMMARRYREKHNRDSFLMPESKPTEEIGGFSN